MKGRASQECKARRQAVTGALADCTSGNLGRRSVYTSHVGTIEKTGLAVDFENLPGS